MRRWRLPALVSIAVLLLFALLGAACTSDGDGDGDGDEAATSTEASAEDGAATAEADATEIPEPPKALRKITFMAGYRPQANLPFVAVYVAADEGYFAAEGLDVDIRHSSGSGEHLKLLLAKEIEFTTATAAQVIVRRADDLPVRAVALFGQRGDQGFVTRADSGIETPEDFAGRNVGFKAGVVPSELKGMLRTAGLTVDDVNLQAVGFDPRIFIEGQIEIYPVFLDNEPDTIRKAGVEINVIDPHDFDVPTLGLTFLAHADTVTDDPELVSAFLRATMRAVEFIAANPGQAVEATLRRAEGSAPEHQRFMLDTDLANAQRADGFGRATLEQWSALEALLREFEVTDAEVDVSTAFDGSFVDALYDDEGGLR